MSWMRSDVSLKIASVVLAVVLWMYLNSEAETVQAFQVPLEVVDVPAGLALTGNLPETVEVRVRASESALLGLSPGRFTARVRMARARRGPMVVPLTPEIVRAPFGVDVLSLDPPQLDLMLEELIAREVPIVASIEGVPAVGYELHAHTLTPDTATIEGPESVVRQAAEVLTQTVDIGGAKESIATNVALLPDRGGLLRARPASVRLNVSIRVQQVTRRFDRVPLEPSGPRDGDRVRIRPETLDVVLEGPLEALDAITRERVRALLDLEGMGPRVASYTVKPRIVLDGVGSEVTVHSISQTTIDVTIGR